MRFIIARSASAAALDSESATIRGRSHSRAAASQTCTLPSKAPHLLEMHTAPPRTVTDDDARFYDRLPANVPALEG
jgi:hypothetical protein